LISVNESNKSGRVVGLIHYFNPSQGLVKIVWDILKYRFVFFKQE
jgi:hypothetical protein